MSLDAAALNEAANAIRRRATAMRAELALADELEKISAVENAAGEAQARVEVLKAQAAEEEADIAQRIEAARVQAAGVMRQAEEYASAVKAEVQRYRQEAQREADGLVLQARNEAHAAIEAAKAEVSKHADHGEVLTEELADVERAIEAAKAEHTEWTGRVADATAEHERVTGMITELVTNLAKPKTRLG